MARALVIGGSVGGLMAGNLLRKAGWDVTIFERARGDLATRGAGLGVSRELAEVLQRCGVRFDGTGGAPNRGYVWMERDGSLAFEHPRENITSAWQRVYKPLREITPPEIYRQGKNLLRVEQDGQSVTAIFEDGTRESGDLLVGADGVYSTVRAQYLPDVEPHYVNYVAWRGIVEEADIPAWAREAIAGHVVNCFPEGEQLLTMAVPGADEDIRPGHRRFYAIWYRPAKGDRLREMFTDASGKHRGIAIPPPLIQQHFIDEVRRDAPARLPPAAAEVIKAAPTLLLQAISDMESPQLVFGRVAIMGDAAFIARPHSAAGVSKAALDAACLADELSRHGSIDAALASYNALRLEFGRSLVAHARYLGAYLEGVDETRDPRKIIEDYGAPHLLHDVPLPAEQ
jgi:2-polyprenyl-6-methoxyphenol hydroxylase-like FAD-dependent oxidoreductase